MHVHFSSSLHRLNTWEPNTVETDAVVQMIFLVGLVMAFGMGWIAGGFK